MKVIVLSRVLQDRHIEKIKKTAVEVGAAVCFVENEEDIPDGFSDAEVLYGFGMGYARKNPALKWLCVPSAGVDYLMDESAFANEDCLLTNSSGAYGVTIAEHMIAFRRDDTWRMGKTEAAEISEELPDHGAGNRRHRK